MAFSGSRLAAGRLVAGLTQERLAQLMHTEQTRVSEWERGGVAPRPALIPRIAAAIGLDALEFLAGNSTSPSLEDMRLAAGLTMDELAAQIGISRNRYRGIEVGATRREPAKELVDALARVLAVPTTTVLRAIETARP